MNNTLIAATHVPLFDRIAGFAEASFDGRLMDAAGLRGSLARDLGRLLNARNGLTVDTFLGRSEASVLEYGIPDVLALSPQSGTDLDTLAAVVQKGIDLFEPRMSHVEVKARRNPKNFGGALVSIAAAVSVGTQLCRVDFDVLMDSQSVQLEGAAR